MKTDNLLIKIKDVSFFELLVSSLLIEFVLLFFLFFYLKTEEIIRDSIRKRDISQIGQILTSPCFTPNQITDRKEYDLFFILKEIGEKDDVYKIALPSIIKDPKTGTKEISMYIHKISKDNNQCALYANLESSFNKATLETTEPNPGEGTGILEGTVDGWNGSPFYFQYSN